MPLPVLKLLKVTRCPSIFLGHQSLTQKKAQKSHIVKSFNVKKQQKQNLKTMMMHKGLWGFQRPSSYFERADWVCSYVRWERDRKVWGWVDGWGMSLGRVFADLITSNCHNLQGDNEEIGKIHTSMGQHLLLLQWWWKWSQHAPQTLWQLEEKTAINQQQGRDGLAAHSSKDFPLTHHFSHSTRVILLQLPPIK